MENVEVRDDEVWWTELLDAELHHSETLDEVQLGLVGFEELDEEVDDIDEFDVMGMFQIGNDEMDESDIHHLYLEQVIHIDEGDDDEFLTTEVQRLNDVENDDDEMADIIVAHLLPIDAMLLIIDDDEVEGLGIRTLLIQEIDANELLYLDIRQTEVAEYYHHLFDDVNTLAEIIQYIVLHPTEHLSLRISNLLL